MADISKYNLHWREDFTYGHRIKRDLFDELVKHLDIRQTIGIIGLRRTGKTVLLKQGPPRNYLKRFFYSSPHQLNHHRFH
jgi:predicted AAA+ superfamily ATPase